MTAIKRPAARLHNEERLPIPEIFRKALSQALLKRGTRAFPPIPDDFDSVPIGKYHDFQRLRRRVPPFQNPFGVARVPSEGLF
ncbi:MAG: hypothetical protein RLO01_13515 [Thalassobaculaceae bacterium]